MRLIVADTSVLVAAFFPERIELSTGGEFDPSARARPVANAIRTGVVRGYAPDVLLAEFLSTTVRIVFERGKASDFGADEIYAQYMDFLTLPLAPVSARKIAATAIDLTIAERVLPPDSWFLAAAMYVGAELWYSHRHNDGIVEKAENIHRGKVFALTERRFA